MPLENLTRQLLKERSLCAGEDSWGRWQKGSEGLDHLFVEKMMRVAEGENSISKELNTNCFCNMERNPFHFARKSGCLRPALEPSAYLLFRSFSKMTFLGDETMQQLYLGARWAFLALGGQITHEAVTLESHVWRCIPETHELLHDGFRELGLVQREPLAQDRADALIISVGHMYTEKQNTCPCNYLTDVTNCLAERDAYDSASRAWYSCMQGVRNRAACAAIRENMCVTRRNKTLDHCHYTADVVALARYLRSNKKVLPQHVLWVEPTPYHNSRDQVENTGGWRHKYTKEIFDRYAPHVRIVRLHNMMRNRGVNHCPGSAHLWCFNSAVFEEMAGTVFSALNSLTMPDLAQTVKALTKSQEDEDEARADVFAPEAPIQNMTLMKILLESLPVFATTIAKGRNCSSQAVDFGIVHNSTSCANIVGKHTRNTTCGMYFQMHSVTGRCICCGSVEHTKHNKDRPSGGTDWVLYEAEAPQTLDAEQRKYGKEMAGWLQDDRSPAVQRLDLSGRKVMWESVLMDGATAFPVMVGRNLQCGAKHIVRKFMADTPSHCANMILTVHDCSDTFMFDMLDPREQCACCDNKMEGGPQASEIFRLYQALPPAASVYATMISDGYACLTRSTSLGNAPNVTQCASRALGNKGRTCGNVFQFSSIDGACLCCSPNELTATFENKGDGRTNSSWSLFFARAPSSQQDIANWPSTKAMIVQEMERQRAHILEQEKAKKDAWAQVKQADKEKREAQRAQAAVQAV